MQSYNNTPDAVPLDRTKESIESQKLFLSQFTKPCIKYSGHYFQNTLLFSLLRECKPLLYSYDVFSFTAMIWRILLYSYELWRILLYSYDVFSFF